jgi:hypothetical protein
MSAGCFVDSHSSKELYTYITLTQKEINATVVSKVIVVHVISSHQEPTVVLVPIVTITQVHGWMASSCGK